MKWKHDLILSLIAIILCGCIFAAGYYIGQDMQRSEFEHDIETSWSDGYNKGRVDCCPEFEINKKTKP
jgi:hypothetical protein